MFHFGTINGRGFSFFILKIIWEGLFYFLDLEKYLNFNENENRGN